MNIFAKLVISALFVCAAEVSAQETTFSLGTSNGAIQSTETLSTSQIDGVLRIAAPSVFGQNFTRDRSNKLFADLASLRIGLAQSISSAIASESTVRQVYSVNVNPIIPTLKLSQNNGTVSGELAQFFVQASIKASGQGIFCPSADVKFNIDNIKAFGEYNVISGDVNNTSISYNITNVSASCNGIFGFIGNLFATGVARDRINSAVASQVNQIVQFANMQRLFSLKDFAASFSRFGQETSISPFTSRVFRVVEEIISNPAINTPGVSLKLIALPSVNNFANHSVILLASHAPALIDSISCFNEIEGNIPPNTSEINIYVMLPRAGATWTLYQTIPAGLNNRFYTAVEGLPANTGVTAIAKNATIGALESFPEKVVSTSNPALCNPEGEYY